MFDGFFPQASHEVVYKKILMGFLPLIPIKRESTNALASRLQTIESHVADQLHSPVRPRLYRGNHFSTFFIR